MTNDERDEMLKATHDAVIKTSTRCESCRKTVCELTRTVRGHNGQPGHTGRIFKLEMAVYAIGGGLLLAVIGWVVSRL
jgi:hypothetical protein